MGLDKQLFRLRRGGGTGACGCVDIFGGRGGFTLPSSTRFDQKQYMSDKANDVNHYARLPSLSGSAALDGDETCHRK